MTTHDTGSLLIIPAGDYTGPVDYSTEAAQDALMARLTRQHNLTGKWPEGYEPVCRHCYLAKRAGLDDHPHPGSPD